MQKKGEWIYICAFHLQCLLCLKRSIKWLCIWIPDFSPYQALNPSSYSWISQDVSVLVFPRHQRYHRKNTGRKWWVLAAKTFYSSQLPRGRYNFTGLLNKRMRWSCSSSQTIPIIEQHDTNTFYTMHFCLLYKRSR